MKGLKSYLIVAGLIVIIYTIAQLNRPKQVDWSETFSDKDKIPFGTYILFNRVKDIFPRSRVSAYHRPVYNVVTQDSAKNASYIIVSGSIDISKTDYDPLIDYVKQGNDVFIASENFGQNMAKKLGVRVAAGATFSRNATSVKFLNPALHPQKVFDVDKRATAFYFEKFDTTRAIVLGDNAGGKANFIKYKIGRGALYLNANPKLFSNYSLLTKDGAEYAAIALSYVKNTGHIAWDEYYTQGDEGEDSPMRVFFNSTALQWAYYITLLSLIVFVLYEIKRRQRIIPLIEPLSNSTLDFVNVVGQVYYERRDNTNIAHKKILYFLEQLRDQHQVKTSAMDEEFIDKLKTKFAIEDKLAKEFVEYVHYINVQERVTDNELINLNRLIEKLNSQFA